MKNLKIWSLAVAILMVVTGCGETTSTGDTFKPGDVSKIVNEWQLIEWGGAEAQFDVYIKFDGANVVLYQRFVADYEKYEGTYTLNGKELSGKYTDGKDFGPYRAEVSVDGGTMRLHKTDGEREIMGVYTKTTIPAWVKDFAVVGGANENDSTEGDGTEGDGTEGDGTEGDGTEGDGTEGDEEQNPAPGTTACRFVGVPFL